MSEKLMFNNDGSAKLNLNTGGSYVVTQWYKSSLAVFEESSFRRYLEELEYSFGDNDNARIAILYFLSAATTMIHQINGGWRISDKLRDYTRSGEEDLYFDDCPDKFISNNDLPVVLIASKNNIDKAIRMTHDKHRADSVIRDKHEYQRLQSLTA